jgi:23S rRNA (uridine2552-2'-O)-methyltransferase
LEVGQPRACAAAAKKHRSDRRRIATIDVVAARKTSAHDSAPDAIRRQKTMGHYDRKDATYHAAKKAGLRSRAGIKLEDLDARFRLLAPGKRVVDLGCWPGAWLQVAAKRVGAAGRVAGVDLVAVEPLGLANVTTIVGDAGDRAVQQQLLDALGGPVDVVLSDLSPKLTGIRASDQAREEALVEIAIDFARRVLVPDGRLLLKLFSHVEQAMTKRLREEFRTVTAFRPPSTRKGSSEMYVAATGRRHSAPAEERAAPAEEHAAPAEEHAAPAEAEKKKENS